MNKTEITKEEVVKVFARYFQRLTKIEERFDDVATKSDVQRIMNALDALLKKADIDDSERLALSLQVGRHENWIQTFLRKRSLP